jgi:L-lactate dehydrogenase complex protein LldG
MAAAMSDRPSILRRIRRALAVPSARHVAPESGAVRPVERVRASLLPAGDSEAERIARFAERCRELRADFVLVDGVAALPAALRALSHREGFVRVATHRSELTDAACRDLSASILSTDGGYDKHELERADAGVTACDALVAQTGSVLVSSRSTGGRAITVLPPHHVVLARREQLVPDLFAAFSLVKARYAGDFPSMLSFITGPSRTGDIERVLVLGAHGPKRLTILCA